MKKSWFVIFWTILVIGLGVFIHSKTDSLATNICR